MSDQELKDLVASIAVGQKRTDEQLAKTDAQLAKTDAQLAKTDAQLAKTDAKLNKIAELVGGIGNNQGYVAEEFFYNSLEEKKELAGVHYDFVDKNWKNRVGFVTDEFDIVMVNGKDVAIVEVKYKAHDGDLEKLITKKYDNFKTLFPAYKDYNHHLALASFYMPDELKEKAVKNNVIVLQRRGDIMETFS